VFDTHGESIGRGGHPGGLAAALDYVDTPASRRAFAEAGVGLIEEVSFQGGDGYLPFFSDTCAFAALTRILEHALERPSADDDPFYAEGDYVREAFTAATQFQVALMRDPDYGALLGGFAANFLHPSGSRPSLREHDDGTARIASASELRAIPHNAALLQLGVAANVLGGLGEAVDRDAGRFASLHTASPRLASLAGLAAYAREIGSFDALAAYVATTAPGLWLARAETTSDARRARRMREVAALLETADLHDSQHRVVRKLHRDFLAFADAVPAGDTDEARATRRTLAVLHALRVALIHEIYLLVTRVPDFAPQLGTSHARIVLRLLNLDVPSAVAVLERIFPSDARAGGDAEEFGEAASYHGEHSRTYEAEHAEVFAPMLALYALVRRISAAVTHRVGFFG
jgi:phosphoenolpyruvate carboxylase